METRTARGKQKGHTSQCTNTGKMSKGENGWITVGEKPRPVWQVVARETRRSAASRALPMARSVAELRRRKLEHK